MLAKKRLLFLLLCFSAITIIPTACRSYDSSSQPTQQQSLLQGITDYNYSLSFAPYISEEHDQVFYYFQVCKVGVGGGDLKDKSACINAFQNSKGEHLVFNFDPLDYETLDDAQKKALETYAAEEKYWVRKDYEQSSLSRNVGEVLVNGITIVTTIGLALIGVVQLISARDLYYMPGAGVMSLFAYEASASGTYLVIRPTFLKWVRHFSQQGYQDTLEHNKRLVGKHLKRVLPEKQLDLLKDTRWEFEVMVGSEISQDIKDQKLQLSEKPVRHIIGSMARKLLVTGVMTTEQISQYCLPTKTYLRGNSRSKFTTSQKCYPLLTSDIFNKKP